MCPHCDVTLTLFGGRRPALPHLRARRGGARHVPVLRQRRPRAPRLRHRARSSARSHGLLPGVELLRLDSDVASSYARLRAVLDRFAAPGAQVLVGTQMIAKGHHFPDVTLVGVVNADLTLHFPDFRAEERTFAMLLQVGGRSGRGERPGRVLVQTLSPEARPIAYAAGGEEERFYAEELERRRELGYPPASTLIGLEVSGSSEEKVDGRRAVHRRAARGASAATASRCSARARCGASAAARACRVVVKTTEMGKTLDTLRRWLGANRDRYAERGVRIVPDVDPQWL